MGQRGGLPCLAQRPAPPACPGVPASRCAEVPGHTAFLSSRLGTAIHLLPLPRQAPALGPPNSVAKALLPRAPDSEGTPGETPSRQPHPSEGGSLPWPRGVDGGPRGASPRALGFPSLRQDPGDARPCSSLSGEVRAPDSGAASLRKAGLGQEMAKYVTRGLGGQQTTPESNQEAHLARQSSDLQRRELYQRPGARSQRD